MSAKKKADRGVDSPDEQVLPLTEAASLLTVRRTPGRFVVNLVDPGGTRREVQGDCNDDKPLKVTIEQ